MRVQSFDWDSWNIEHIARHGVDPSEAEAICRSHRAVVIRSRKGRHLVYGQTGEGRYVLIVLAARSGGLVRIITARDMSEQERRFYQGRR